MSFIGLIEAREHLPNQTGLHDQFPMLPQRYGAYHPLIRIVLFSTDHGRDVLNEKAGLPTALVPLHGNRLLPCKEARKWKNWADIRGRAPLGQCLRLLGEVAGHLRSMALTSTGMSKGHPRQCHRWESAALALPDAWLWTRSDGCGVFRI
jgi:hypothetical protein